MGTAWFSETGHIISSRALSIFGLGLPWGTSSSHRSWKDQSRYAIVFYHAALRIWPSRIVELSGSYPNVIQIVFFRFLVARFHVCFDAAGWSERIWSQPHQKSDMLNQFSKWRFLFEVCRDQIKSIVDHHRKED